MFTCESTSQSRLVQPTDRNFFFSPVDRRWTLPTLCCLIANVLNLSDERLTDIKEPRPVHAVGVLQSVASACGLFDPGGSVGDGVPPGWAQPEQPSGEISPHCLRITSHCPELSNSQLANADVIVGDFRPSFEKPQHHVAQKDNPISRGSAAPTAISGQTRHLT